MKKIPRQANPMPESFNTQPRPIVLRPAPKPKPDPKPKTAFERFLLARLEKLEERLACAEANLGDVEDHLGW